MSIINAQLNWQHSTPINKKFGDSYFSLVDGLAETEYVFLAHNQLPERWKNRQTFVIAETGFGTGLNFLVTAAKWLETTDRTSHLTFYSVEKYPLSREDLARSFEYWPQFSAMTSQLLNAYPDRMPGFHTLEFSKEKITLVLLIGDVLTMLSHLQCQVDCWYLDGFSPAKNPAMWSLAVCQKMASLSKKNTRFATFTAAGQVRRNLQAVGFDVEKTSGFGKKREMLSGFFTGNKAEKNLKLPWFSYRPESYTSPEEVAIIGGGLAGLSCAWMLARNDIRSTVIEAGNGLASGASGNAAGIVVPRLSLDFNLSAQFYSSSFLYAVACLNLLNNENRHLGWQQSGVLQLAPSQRVEKMVQMGLSPSFLHGLTREQASAKAGVQLKEGGFLYPAGGYVNPFKLCLLLAEVSEKFATVRTKISVHRLTRSDDCWHLFDEGKKLIVKAKTIIFANGFDAQRLLNNKSLLLATSRGQLSYVPTQEDLSHLRLPVCSEGYIIPKINNYHVIGATYARNNESLSLCDDDHLKNWQNVEQFISGKFQFNANGMRGRVSFRTTTRDHLPLVGPVPDEQAFRLDYAEIRHGRNSDQYPLAKYIQNAYLTTGHGSRGLVSCFSSAEYLTSLIAGKPVTLPENISYLLHPGRFLIRNLKRGIDESDFM